jgi:hypothetical protein
VKEVPTLGSPFFSAFSSVCIYKALNEVSVYLFLQGSNSSKYGELFEATTWVHKLQSLRVNILT